jgi:ATP-binding cassette, subfamily B, bacterial
MKNIKKIITLSRSLARHLVALSLLVFVMSLLQQTQPFFVKFIVDNIQVQITTGKGSLQTVALLMAALLIVNLFSSILNSISMRYGDFINSRLRKFLTERFYQKVFTLPQKYFDSEISGKILNQLNRGIQSIQDFMSMMTNFVLPAIFQSIFTIGILLYYNLLIGLLAFAIFPFYIYLSHYSTKKWGKEEVKKNKLEDISRGRIQEVISNIRLVRSYGTQRREWNFVSNKLERVNRIYDSQSTTYHIINFIREFSLELVLFGISLIVFVNTFNQTLTLGEMVLILQLLGLLRRPLFAMSFILERIQRAEAGSKEYFEIMGLASIEALPAKNPSIKSRFDSPTITFKNVSFRYEEESKNVLRGLNFTIHPQETVALVGHSGAGKTTIINLICKFYEPTGGQISLKGHSYRNLTHAQVRDHISLVFQDSELFSTTVKENVAYGKPDSSNSEIITALKKANAYGFVKKLPQGLNSEIGERGVKLSGGQKQRIQIARAILRNSPILILDEATSSLDSKSENLIQRALDNLTHNKLVIIIAHRFSTIQNADRIFVIDGGRLVDSGQPGTLAKKDGIYSELLRYQIEGNQKLLEKYDLTA